MRLRTVYLLFLPLFIILGIVVVYPLMMSLYLSLTTTSGQVSASNYATLLSSATFLDALNVSLLYSLTSTIIALGIGLGLAFIVTQGLRGKGVFEALYVLPVAVAPIVVGVLFSPSSVWDDIVQFLHFQLGQPYPVINELSPTFFFPVMFLSEAWEWAPLLMLVALSIINSTPKEIYEAADLSGASSYQQFRMISLPTIFRSSVMQFVVVLRFIDAMRAFEIPFAWSNWLGYTSQIGSPVDTISLYLYKLLFSSSLGFPIGVVSAAALALFGVTLVGAAVLLRILRSGGRGM